jgi:hypothetical protein
MAKLNINIGNSANDKGGDTIRVAFNKVNLNFAELYSNLTSYLPNPASNSGKFLTTDGVHLVWQTLPVPDPVVAPIAVGSTGPITHPEGTLWFDNVSGRLYVYFDSSWIDASPKGVAGAIMSGTKASNSPGTVGQISYDSNFIYVCTATNTWKRSPLTGGY